LIEANESAQEQIRDGLGGVDREQLDPGMRALTDVISNPLTAKKEAENVWGEFTEQMANMDFKNEGVLLGIWTALFAGSMTLLNWGMAPLRMAAPKVIETMMPPERTSLQGTIHREDRPHIRQEQDGGVSPDEAPLIDGTPPGGGRSALPLPSSSAYLAPVAGAILTSGFRTRGRPKHNGLDLAVQVGTNIVAPYDGYVIETRDNWTRYGATVTFRDTNGYCHLFAHCSDISIAKELLSRGTTEGAPILVSQGEPVAKSGGKVGAWGAGNSKGPHLHWEIQNTGITGACEFRGKSIDPAPFTGQAMPAGEGPGGGWAYIDPRELISTPHDDAASSTCELNPIELYAFMKAVHTQESGSSAVGIISGRASLERTYFNISDANWHGVGGDNNISEEHSWAKKYLQDISAKKTIENEITVAKEQMSEYFNQFCSWRKVAMAWYKGDSFIGQLDEDSTTSAYGNYYSLRQYIDSIMTMYEVYSKDIENKISSGEDISSLLAEYNINSDKLIGKEGRGGDRGVNKIAGSFKYM
jgi:murein DD-endopeptidase MepM/ murein hydrolase activator NlpD